MYFVVVCGESNFGKAVAHPASFTGPDKDALIQKAIAVRTEMSRRAATSRYTEAKTYKIFVGEVLASVEQPPIEYVLKPIEIPTPDPGR